MPLDNLRPPLDTDEPDDMEEFCDDCGYPLDQCVCDDGYEEDEDDDG